LCLGLGVDEIVDERNEKGDVDPARLYIRCATTPVLHVRGEVSPRLVRWAPK
jgi:hypothetical protein